MVTVSRRRSHQIENKKARNLNSAITFKEASNFIGYNLRSKFIKTTKLDLRNFVNGLPSRSTPVLTKPTAIMVAQ